MTRTHTYRFEITTDNVRAREIATDHDPRLAVNEDAQSYPAPLQRPATDRRRSHWAEAYFSGL